MSGERASGVEDRVELAPVPVPVPVPVPTPAPAAVPAAALPEHHQRLAGVEGGGPGERPVRHTLRARPPRGRRRAPDVHGAQRPQRARRRMSAVSALLGIAAGLLLSTAAATATATPAHAASCAKSAGSPVIEAESWGQQRMGAERAWPRTTGGVVVAVIDTGVSASAASLQGAVLPGTDLAGGAGDVDCYGRGTFVGSLIAGRAMEGTEFVGIAPGATILPVRVTNDPGDYALGARLPSLLAQGIQAAVAGGARVIAVPLTAASSSPELAAAVQAAAAADVVVVAAASAPTTDAPAYPAAIDGVLSVAPLTSKGGAAPSALGAEPDLAAPSGGLVGAVPDGAGHVTGDEADLAVAYAAGAAALVRSEFPALTAQQVGERLMATADGSTAPRADGAEADPSLGHGVVDPVAAVSRLDPESVVTASGSTPQLVMPPKLDERPSDMALMIGLALVALVLATLGPLLGIVAVRRRRAAPMED
ncbi:S8 family serine peptidase [Schumannella soli]|uniref:S8 family serine peptidase n=1 Tax=Schumannella soli TaxID=2590779 RepID=A0A506XYB7_9MICO|nr:S8 family serine peptidase [Schumannella soli]TPW77914.1 S8 family serine peptidase [Schumannella soli]